jgi:energy-coupling factor transporter transmembrane protein EcfT
MARIAFHYFPGDSLLHRWDARCKILGLLIITLSLLPFKVPLFIFNSVILIGLLTLFRFPLKQFFREFRFWTIFLFILFLFQTLFSQGTRLSFLPWLPASKEGLILGGITVWRLGLILCYATLFTAVTRPRELQDAITWFIKPVPFLSERRIGLMVSLTIRFFSIILDEAEEIRLAHKARLGDQNKNPFRRAKFLALPLLRHSFSRAEEVTLALAARGYRDDLPLHLPKLSFSHLIPLFFLLGFFVVMVWFYF